MMQDYIWGDGDPEGVRRRAADEMVKTASVCKTFMEMRPASLAASPIPPTVTALRVLPSGSTSTLSRRRPRR